MSERDPLPTRDLVTIGGIALLVYLVARVLKRGGELVHQAGDAAGEFFYELTHADFAATNFADGVLLPDGRRINIPRESINEGMLFPFQGVLYSLMRSDSGELAAVRAAPGQRYDYDTFYVIQQASGNAKVFDK